MLYMIFLSKKYLWKKTFKVEYFQSQKYLFDNILHFFQTMFVFVCMYVYVHILFFQKYITGISNFQGNNFDTVQRKIHWNLKKWKLFTTHQW